MATDCIRWCNEGRPYCQTMKYGREGCGVATLRLLFSVVYIEAIAGKPYIRIDAQLNERLVEAFGIANMIARGCIAFRNPFQYAECAKAHRRTIRLLCAVQ